MAHHAGYVNLIGKPNVGKSTLMNAMLGKELAIVTRKAQTTRHRILGIRNGPDYQVIFSDTPGIIEPKYGLQEAMMRFVHQALEDADLMLLLTDTHDNPKAFFASSAWQKISRAIRKHPVPMGMLLNKIDRLKSDDLKTLIEQWERALRENTQGVSNSKPTVLPISALKQLNLKALSTFILEHLPESPPYFPKDQLTDRSERFIAAERIREKIYRHLRQEVPYSTEVVVTAYKDERDAVYIYADIVVAKKTQQPILIGKGGQTLKKIGTQARLDLEEWLDKHVVLKLYVKVRDDWRNKPQHLKSFGY